MNGCTINRMLFGAVAATLLGGCSERLTNQQNDARTIKLNAAIEQSNPSKAAAGDATALSAVQFLRVDATTAPTSFTGITPINGSRGEDGVVDFANTQKYSLDLKNTYFLGYHPEGTLAANIVTWTIDGKIDVLHSSVYDAGTNSLPNTAATNPMTFNHKLAQLEVICQADPTANVDLAVVRSAWGEITKIELLETPTEIKYTYATNAVANGTTTAAKTLLQKNYETAFASVDIPTSTNATVTAAGMFAPTTTTAAIKLKIYTENVTAGKEVTVQLKTGATNKGFEAGKKHTATLVFKPDAKTITITKTSITDWADGYAGSADGEVRYSTMMTYGEAPFSSTTDLSGSTTTSYNGWVGTVANGGNGEYHGDESHAAKYEQPYYQLEVALQDEPQQMVWQAAREACWAKTTSGGGWRLPRATEHWWIVVNATELAKVAGFVAMKNDYYATATEVDKDQNGMSHSTPNGTMKPFPKTDLLYVRCVREWPITPIAPWVPTGGVKVGDLCWATGNLVASGNNSCKIGAPTDYGVYFQFGSLVGWTGGATGNGVGATNTSLSVDKAVWPAAMGATKPSFAWQSKDADGTATLANYYFNYAVAPWNASGSASADIGTFDKTVTGQGATTGTLRGGRYANLGVGDPCTYYLGGTWRLPTTAEYTALFAGVADGTAWSAVTGWDWQYPTETTPAGAAGPSSLFIPVTGLRIGSQVGSFTSITVGYYWSSSVTNATNGYNVNLKSNGVVRQNTYLRSEGLPVRCVADLR